MKLIFTKSGLPLSVAIRGLLNEPVSHFGIVFDNGVVFHSNLLGTHIEWYGSFVKHCEIVYQLDYEMSLEQEETIYRNILNTYDDKPYDFGALFYFAYSAVCHRLFGTALALKNKWAKSDSYLCTELAATLPDSIIATTVKTEDLSIISPYQLYLQIKAGRTEKE